MRGTYGLLLGFLLLYLLFPTQNSTLDAYYYAASVRYGNELFLPHHLLYNAFGYAVLKLLQSLGLHPDVLPLLKALNALAAAGCLSVFCMILGKLTENRNKLNAVLLVAGSSFGFWRFATENETYILPLLFSLLGSHFFLRYLRTGRTTALPAAGAFAAVACLFHQIHFFWWLGLAAGVWLWRKDLRHLLLYALPALLVPLCYLLVLAAAPGAALRPASFFRFVFHDFYTGAAGGSFSLKQSVLLTGVNLVRTFLQLHGNLLFFLKQHLLWLLPGLLSLALFFAAFFRKMLEKRPGGQELESAAVFFVKVHVLVAVLQLAFAFYAAGNAEFMVMLPVLLLLATLLFPLQPRFYLLSGLGLLLWNFCYGIFPGYYFSFSNNSKLLHRIHHEPQHLYILAEDAQLRNEYYYHYGTDNLPAIQRAPSAMVQRGENPETLHQQIARYQQSGLQVYTDCLHRPQVLSRASLLLPQVDSAFFSRYRLTAADTVQTFYGPKVLSRLEPAGQTDY